MSNKNNNIKILCKWLSHQNQNYKNKTDIMCKTHEIYDKWSEFINDTKYKKYFLLNEEKWIEIFNEVKKYIDENNKRPPIRNQNNKNNKLGTWVITQIVNFQKKIQIMSNLKIYNIWNEFINTEKYKKYFISNEEEWANNLNKLKLYFDENNKRPSINDKNINVKYLGNWFFKQIYNYKNKKQIMFNDDIYNKWTIFINDNKYKIYFD